MTTRRGYGLRILILLMLMVPAPVLAQGDTTDTYGDTIELDLDLGAELRAAAKAGKRDEVRRLINTGARDKINETDNQGNTALILAVKHNKNDVAIFLIQSRANKDVKNQEGKTALDWAMRRQNDELIKALGGEVGQEKTDPNERKKKKRFFFFRIGK